MNNLRTFAAVFFALLLAPALRADQTTDAVTAHVRDFYKFYLHALNANAEPENSKTTMKRYVSARMLKEIARLSKVEGGIESDPYISAQDFDKAWEKNIAVEVSGAAGGKAMAKVTLSGGEMTQHHLKLKLIEEGGAWKIDRVDDLDLH